MTSRIAICWRRRSRRLCCLCITAWLFFVGRSSQSTSLVESSWAFAQKSENPESPAGIQVSPAASVPSRHHSDENSGGESAVSIAIAQAAAAYAEEDRGVEEQQQQEQEKEEEQEREETNSAGGSFPPSRQPDAPAPASTIRLLESGMISECQSPEAVQGYDLQSQSTSRIVSPVRAVACAESGPRVSIRDITFLHVEGRREAAGGPKYLFVGKMWLPPGEGVPSELLEVYTREVAQKTRLATRAYVMTQVMDTPGV
jgi:hypothetical protein